MYHRNHAGRAVLLVSVELDEIMALSDRIAVMFDGRIMGERLPDQATATDLGCLMAGVEPDGDAAAAMQAHDRTGAAR